MTLKDRLRKEALEKLAWPRLMEYLSKESLCPQNVLKLKKTNPWISAQERHNNLTRISEIQSLEREKLFVKLKPFDDTEFKALIRRHQLLRIHDLIQVFLSLESSEDINKTFNQNSKRFKLLAPSLSRDIQNLNNLGELHRLLKESLDRDSNDIKETASLKLKTLKQKLSFAYETLENFKKDFIQRQDVRAYLQHQSWVEKNESHVLALKIEYKSKIKGYFHGLSHTEQSIFIEPYDMQEHTLRVQSIKEDIRLEIQRIIKELSYCCFKNGESLAHNLEILNTLDCLSAMSSFSTKLEGVCPEFESDKNQVSLVAKDFIHPLMKLENKETVSNTFFMEGLSIPPRIFIVSGPNAGGKTFFIKTIGALTALALSGLYVSAKYMRVYDFSSIFLEIGDRQNLEQSLSSFSGHLLQMKKIMSVCDSKSLVLLDESFIGTEPNVGAALARSSLDYLANKGAVVFLTTHFSQLKFASSEDLKFYNLSMAFDSKSLLPTYKLLLGIPGQSYALELATSIHLDKEIIKRARDYVGKGVDSVEIILKDLHERKKKIDDTLEDICKREHELKEKRERLQEEKILLKEKHNAALDECLRKFNRLYKSFKDKLSLLDIKFLKNNSYFSSKDASESRKDEGDSKNDSLQLDLKKDSQSKNTLNKKGKKVKIERLSDLSKIALSPKVDLQNKKISPKTRVFSSKINFNDKSPFESLEHQFKKALNEIQSLKKRENHETISNFKDMTIEVGMKVLVESMHEEGVVLSVNKNKELIACLFGAVKILVPFKNIKKVLGFQNKVTEESHKKKHLICYLV